MNKVNELSGLEKARAIDGANLLDDSERFYRIDREGFRVYGYFTQLGGLYVCYTCGHLCECGEEGE
jgi:hypothetical protein